jgi:phosphonate transport system substrate-binding protein
MVWRKSLPQEMKERILYFFLTYGRSGGAKEIAREREILAQMSDGWGPFLASSDLQLIPTRQLELFSDKTRIENDAGLSEEEKKLQLAEIDARLKDLAELEKIAAPAPTN